MFSAGALITGFTALSIFPAVRMYLSEQFPTALRGRGHFFGESFARMFAGVMAAFRDGLAYRLADDLLWHDDRHGR